MNWLIISILSNAGLFLVFKYLSHKKIRVLPVIVINYWCCFSIGNLVPGHDHVFSYSVIQSNWFLPVLCMGLLFIIGFYSMGTATGKAGAAASSVSSKMSVIIPACISLLLFKENLLWMQYIGIGISLLSVFLMVEPVGKKRFHGGLWLLILVFFTSGAVDTGLNLIGHYFGNNSDPFLTSAVMFGAAGVLGILVLLFSQRHLNFTKLEIFGGLLLGAINYISLVAILSGLALFTGKTAWFFAVNNIGVVGVSSIIAAVFFKEKLHRSGYLGLALALLAIVLMNTDAFF